MVSCDLTIANLAIFGLHRGICGWRMLLLLAVVFLLIKLYASVPKHFSDASWVGCRLAEILPIALSEKQYCLELDDPIARLARLSPLIRKAEE